MFLRSAIDSAISMHVHEVRRRARADKRVSLESLEHVKCKWQRNLALPSIGSLLQVRLAVCVGDPLSAWRFLKECSTL